MRPSNRRPDELRKISIEPGFMKHADGSCLIRTGETHVVCTATIEDKTPPFLRNTGKGWITAEYGMIPCSAHSRINREAAIGKQSGRTQEIQRLISRSLRSVTNLQGFGERQIRLDCDVLQADGGTRTAAITGAYVALFLAFQKMQSMKTIQTIPLTDQVAAISCGLYKGEPVLDLDYAEDSQCQADANFVLTGRGGIVEIQGTAEEKPFSEKEYQRMMDLAKQGVKSLLKIQLQACGLITHGA